MESSSENSFTWTDTSSDSTENSIKPDNDSAIDLERDIKHEKKMKSKIASRSCNGTEEILETKDKVKEENDQLHSESRNVKRSKVKLEPESDSDIPKKKKKRKYIEGTGDQNDLQDSTSYDESYLDLRVKQEKAMSMSSSHPTKKKRKQSTSDGSKLIEEFKYKENNCDALEATQPSSESVLHETEVSSKSKKKKKKSKKRHNSEDEGANESKENITEESREQHNTSNNSIRDASATNNNTFQNESSCEDISAIQFDGDENVHTVLFSDGQTEKGAKTKDNLHKSTLISQFKSSHNYDGDISQEKQTPRISDRIRFEDSDDPDVEVDHTHLKLTEARSSHKLRKFVKTLTTMKQVSQTLQTSAVITTDDDIWIVKCPKEIDIQAFCDTDLNIHGKCRIKIGGQTYDGSLEDGHCNTATALSMKNNNFEIENLPLCGIINFRKRIPKAHIRDDNIMVNNQTNFIPLPEIKCRHPLFGSNYKKALKLPATVMERLNTTNSAERAISIEKKRKKKHKKERIQENEESDSNNKCVTKLEPNITISEKKKMKRKHCEDEGPAAKRVRKVKHDPESADAWDSEKAIEQNLFDF